MGHDARKLQYYRRRGFETERMLVRFLRAQGIAAYRIPASGLWESRKKMNLPDVIAFLSGQIIGFQVKSTDRRRYSFSAYELAGLRDFVTDLSQHGVSVKGIAIVRFVQKNKSYWSARVLEPQHIVTVEVDGKTRYRFISREVAILYRFNIIQHGYPLETLLRKLGIVR